jgi:hypothetical protein
VADEQEDKPADESARETAVGHQVVDEDAAKDEGTTEVFFSRDEPQPQPAAAPQSPTSGGTSPAAADRQAAQDTDSFSEKPELFIGGAFVGAFVVAKLLKKLTGGDD